MKNPQITILMISLFVLLSSCQRDQVISPPVSPMQDTISVDLRCCSELADEIKGHELFTDGWELLFSGLITPSIETFGSLDTSELNANVRILESCIDSNRDPVACLDAFFASMQLENFLEGFDPSVFASLREEFSHVGDDEYYIALEEALGQAIDETYGDRRLPCFVAYRARVASVTAQMLKILSATTDVGAIVAFVSGAIMAMEARRQFCDCLYNNYGTGC